MEVKTSSQACQKACSNGLLLLALSALILFLYGSFTVLLTEPTPDFDKKTTLYHDYLTVFLLLFFSQAATTLTFSFLSHFCKKLALIGCGACLVFLLTIATTVYFYVKAVPAVFEPVEKVEGREDE